MDPEKHGVHGSRGMTDRLTTAAQVARLAQLDRRYVAARDALQFALDCPSPARWARYRWYAARYARLWEASGL